MAKGWTAPSRDEESECRRLARELGRARFYLPGSVAVRSYPCGKSNCACHADPPRLHGPYVQWSRSTGGRTVHRRLSEEQLADYGPLFDEARRLRAILEELETLTLQIVERDTRFPHRSA